MDFHFNSLFCAVLSQREMLFGFHAVANDLSIIPDIKHAVDVFLHPAPLSELYTKMGSTTSAWRDHTRCESFTSMAREAPESIAEATERMHKVRFYSIQYRLTYSISHGDDNGYASVTTDRPHHGLT
jgi:hypothetical protein